MDGLIFYMYGTHDGVPTMKDSDIIALYRQTEDEGLSGVMFNDGSIQNAYEFLDYVKTPGCIFFSISLQDKPLGYFWLNRIEETHAYCHFCCFKEFWGDGRTVKVGQAAMRLCLDEFSTIMGMLPSTNTFAINYLLKVGLHKVGTIPNLVWSERDQKPVEGTMLYITAEELE